MSGRGLRPAAFEKGGREVRGLMNSSTMRPPLTRTGQRTAKGKRVPYLVQVRLRAREGPTVVARHDDESGVEFPGLFEQLENFACLAVETL